MLRRGTRPGRGEIDGAALGLLTRHGAQVLATARRYAATPEDAEDAYQRGLEILLTKAPTTDEDELVPWLKTVVKHEAFALRRQRERHSPVTDDGHLGERPTPAAITTDQAERFEQLSQGAEALGDLKPQEIRALVLRAEGYTYREICDITGWTYTKVNRCLTEGRRAFLGRLSAIRAGEECERLEPVLSAVADGEAGADELALLRPHMKTCLSCRARLREFREAPGRVAALFPMAALTGTGGEGLRGPLEAAIASVQQKLDGLVGATQHKAAALGERAGMAGELVAGQKLAAVAASAAALAGGGTAIDHFAGHHGPPRPDGAEVARTPERAQPEPRKAAARAAPAATAAQPAPSPTKPIDATADPPAAGASPPPTPARQQASRRRARPAPAPTPDPANEFAPSATATAASSAPTTTANATGAAQPIQQAPAAPAPAKPAAPTGQNNGASEFNP
jgi:RNA polymerase sigma factor (sigma-70 family)